MSKLSPLLNKTIKGKEIVSVVIKSAPDRLTELREHMIKVHGLDGIKHKMFDMFSVTIPTRIISHLETLDIIEFIGLNQQIKVPESDFGDPVFELTSDDVKPSRFFPLLGSLLMGDDTREIRKPLEPNPKDWPTSDTRMMFNPPDNVTGKGIKIAVIDSDGSHRLKSHPQLEGKIDTITIKMGAVTDSNGHGSWCTTCAMGRKQTAPNGLVCEGVAPGATGWCIKALYGPMGVGMTSDLLLAIEEAINLGADVISCSWGGKAEGGWQEDILCLAIHDVRDKAIFVVAAGNEGDASGTVGSPGISPDVITVGAIDKIGKLADFSSRGPTPDGLIKPDVVAPGVDTFSGIENLTILSVVGGKGTPEYAAISGTSMSTPHIAGLVALLLEAGLIRTTEDFLLICKNKGESKSNDRGYGLPQWEWFTNEIPVEA